MQFITNNPAVTACLMVCIWPAFVGFLGAWFGRTVERYGWPVVSWSSDTNNTTEEGGL